MAYRDSGGRLLERTRSDLVRASWFRCAELPRCLVLSCVAGDSVNAMLAAVRIAVQTGRLFFIDWMPTKDVLLEPGSLKSNS